MMQWQGSKTLLIGAKEGRELERTENEAAENVYQQATEQSRHRCRELKQTGRVLQGGRRMG